jgi:hypothetical protein
MGDREGLPAVRTRNRPVKHYAPVCSFSISPDRAGLDWFPFDGAAASTGLAALSRRRCCDTLGDNVFAVDHQRLMVAAQHIEPLAHRKMLYEN